MTKKIIKYILWGLLTILIFGGVGAFVFLKGTAPDYQGEKKFHRLHKDVKVNYDKFGIPHIYAENAQDAYRVLGYVHAQDRLFQMEMIRRLSGGRLAEILGERLISTDQFFRTLGIRKMAETSADRYFQTIDADWKRHTLAYLEGVNKYVAHGKTPIEFSILGIEKSQFEPADVYSILGYMGLGFSRALKEDPVMDKILQKYGRAYLTDWVLDTKIADSLITRSPEKDDLSMLIPQDVEEHLAQAGLPLWYGSNGWVISEEKSTSGKVLLANDTHIGISQPSVWFEAHISYPGFDFYGNHIAGVPFAIIGHSRDLGWGLTIFPFDGIDLYRERLNPDDSSQVWATDQWQEMDIQEERIKVKDQEDIIFERKVTRHGPIINTVASAVDSTESDPISFWWNYLEGPTTTLDAIYTMNHSSTLQEFKEGVKKIDFIGLNVLYGDQDGNIAHWGSGRIPKRPTHVNPKFILDGASGKDELLGFYDFSENPQSENPEIGYIASANQDPGMVDGNYFHGYYCPKNRYNRIKHHLKKKKKWSQEDMKSIQLDEISDDHKAIARQLFVILSQSSRSWSLKEKEIIDLLGVWDGGYGLEQVGPVIFTKLIYHTLRNAMLDELGEEDFNSLLGSYLLKGSMLSIIENEVSVWWDDLSTNNKREDRKEHVFNAFKKSVAELDDQLGTDWKQWKWQEVHTITHNHPLGAVKPLDKVFNVGPYPVSGGNDVPNKMMYRPESDGTYEVYSSPALRILLDFANIDASESINPTGQSGSVMSPHYDDQTIMFNEGFYRPQLMNKEAIENQSTTLLLKAN